MMAAAQAVGRALGRTVRVVADRRPVRGEAATDAIGLLTRDHRRLEALLNRGTRMTERDVAGRDDLFDRELTPLSRSDERWGAKFKGLKENIEHHIEEEEDDMFKKARSVLGRDELARMGERMEKMKAETI